MSPALVAAVRTAAQAAETTAPCLLTECDSAGHPEECTRLLGEVAVAGQLEVSTELVASATGLHVSVLGMGAHHDEALIQRCRTRGELLALAGQFADVAALIEAAVDLLPEDTTGVCAVCERTWDCGDLHPDGDGDPVCVDCHRSDTSAEDYSAYRSYLSGR
ncbi:hypothetical protein [Streptacidiphilus carbonis]|uniref:hypothetical protein n=1 Tax=Streptacidiphilus carbonis TaxID=105422 RepID=UPI0005A827F7|nr:hypothetical protein [Streptacidiphilus carbonis]